MIVESVCRYTINQTYSGRNVANVLDIAITDVGGLDSREAAIADFGEELLEAWNDTISLVQTNEVGLVSVSWVDLDSADGETGSTTTGSGNAVWPSTGTSTSASMPGSVAMLARKQISQGRGRRNGRMYICGVGEDKTDSDVPNTLNGQFVSDVNAQLALFLAECNQQHETPDYTARLVVVHVTARDVDGNPTAGDYREVTSLTLDSTLATQRDRLR